MPPHSSWPVQLEEWGCCCLGRESQGSGKAVESIVLGGLYKARLQLEHWASSGLGYLGPGCPSHDTPSPLSPQAKTKGLQSGVDIGVKYSEKQERNTISAIVFLPLEYFSYVEPLLIYVFPLTGQEHAPWYI